MNNLNNYIQEKLKLNKDTKIYNSENWSIDNAEDGDFVNWNGSELYFIYKCLNQELETPIHQHLDDDTIIYHAAYNFNLDSLDIGPESGVGDIKRKENFSLASDDKKEAFIKVLKDYGYKWDENKKELIKI